MNIVNNRGLQARFGVTSIPHVIVFAPEYDVHATYHWKGHQHLLNELPEWVSSRGCAGFGTRVLTVYRSVALEPSGSASSAAHTSSV